MPNRSFIVERALTTQAAALATIWVPRPEPAAIQPSKAALFALFRPADRQSPLVGGPESVAIGC
jgi:hypothetical protein